MRSVLHSSNGWFEQRSQPRYSGSGWRAAGLRAMLGVALLVGGRAAWASDGFIAPTPEELAMKSVPGYPGAPAVMLLKEEITNDSQFTIQHYERIKVLTDEGKRYANVELQYVSYEGDGWDRGDYLKEESIVGRTVEPDGRIVPFTGKPFFKVIEKANGIKFQEKVFTLPEVEVGSIIEYRYATRYENFVLSPTWMIQGDLFVKHAHFVWYPTDHALQDDEGNPITAISWFPLLPPGVKIEHHEGPSTLFSRGPSQIYELSASDVPPKVEEEFMPPLKSYSYRVMFAFTPWHTSQEYWAHAGKTWSKGINTFTEPNRELKEATAKITAGATTPEEKLKKIYAAVMGLENTHFTHSRDKREDKAAGVVQVRTAADVFSRERGTPKELTELFIAMARVAGYPAYAMYVPDREEELFVPDWQSFEQFDDLIAIVNVDGKEQFFDPGSRYVPFGQLAWQHTYVQGLRQVEGGTKFDVAPGVAVKANRTTRVANLTMNAQGEISGKIDLTFNGSPALRWRQLALRGDEEGVKHALRTSLEEMVPNTLEVEVDTIKGLKDYEEPLVVSYKVKGGMGTQTGKRLLLPSDVFLADAKATFPHEKRELAVDFHYPQYLQDAVRINIPDTFTVEAVPSSATMKMADRGSYAINIEGSPKYVTTRRDFVFGAVIVPVKEYGDLRSFYTQMESKDGESIVLKSSGTTTASLTPSGTK